HRVNVAGTENVLAASRTHGIRRLVFTSSPSVVFDGRDQEGIDESAPYPARFEAPYPQTKALAERLVRAANGPSLATVALRPHLVWGPGEVSARRQRSFPGHRGAAPTPRLGPRRQPPGAAHPRTGPGRPAAPCRQLLQVGR